MVGLMWLKLGPPSQGTPPFDRGGWVLSPWAATVPVSLWCPSAVQLRPTSRARSARFHCKPRFRPDKSVIPTLPRGNTRRGFSLLTSPQAAVGGLVALPLQASISEQRASSSTHFHHPAASPGTVSGRQQWPNISYRPSLLLTRTMYASPPPSAVSPHLTMSLTGPGRCLSHPRHHRIRLS